jgi:hypothetical protein
MSNVLFGMGVAQLQRAIEIKKQIQDLEEELQRLAQDSSGSAAVRGSAVSVSLGRRKMSAAGRARIAAAQRARWAKHRSAAGGKKTGSGRRMSPAARARIAAAAKARWAKAKAAGKNSL